MDTISPEWTEQERLAVVSKIANEIAQNNKPLFTYDEVMDWAYRLSFLATKPPWFLEANRDSILRTKPDEAH